MRASIAALTGMMAALWPALEVRSEAIEAFYKGRDLQILVGNPAGGGYDVYARFLARHLGRFVPGHPNVVVVNMPGANA